MASSAMVWVTTKIDKSKLFAKLFLEERKRVWWCRNRFTFLRTGIMRLSAGLFGLGLLFCNVMWECGVWRQAQVNCVLGTVSNPGLITVSSIIACFSKHVIHYRTALISVHTLSVDQLYCYHSHFDFLPSNHLINPYLWKVIIIRCMPLYFHYYLSPYWSEPHFPSHSLCCIAVLDMIRTCIPVHRAFSTKLDWKKLH
jgi:hypothetical protein